MEPNLCAQSAAIELHKPRLYRPSDLGRSGVGPVHSEITVIKALVHMLNELPMRLMHKGKFYTYNPRRRMLAGLQNSGRQLCNATMRWHQSANLLGTTISPISTSLRPVATRLAILLGCRQTIARYTLVTLPTRWHFLWRGSTMVRQLLSA